jgi:hypothetical protein
MEIVDTAFAVEYGNNGGGDVVVEINKSRKDGKVRKTERELIKNGKYFLTSGHRTFGLNKIYICELFELIICRH